MQKSTVSSHQFWSGLLAQLASKFGVPTDELPVTRCILKKAFIEALIDIRDELALDGYKSISGTEILAYLTTAQVARVITVQLPSEFIQEKFVVLGFGESLEVAEPLELLQAMIPNGVICYFTAIGYHGLTTQPVSHHHIARLRHYPQRVATSVREVLVPVQERRAFDPLGSKQFTYQDLSYYLTQREEQLVAGVQKRYLDTRSIIRITTLEQTLLDTLHKPFSCGGAAVVFEAWETGLEKLDEVRLVEHLKAIANPNLNRRVGYIIENMGYKPKRVLEEYLSIVREGLGVIHEKEIIPLLPGISSSEVDVRWLVEVP